MRLVAVVLALGVGSCSEVESGGTTLDCGPQRGTVVRVVDGDTVDIAAVCADDSDCHDGACEGGVCGKDQRIRLVAVETGEIHSRVDCFGAEAHERLQSLILGTEVELGYDPVAGCTGDRGRLLAYVLSEGEPVQVALAREGYACLDWHRHEARKAETPFFEELDAAQSSAQSAGLRIWAPNIREVCGDLQVHPDCTP